MVRRRIRAGGIGARLEHRRYFIYDQTGVHSGDEAPTQNGQVDIQIEQASDREDSQESNPVFSQQTDPVQLLATATAQNSNMMVQLNLTAAFF